MGIKASVEQWLSLRWGIGVFNNGTCMYVALSSCTVFTRTVLVARGTSKSLSKGYRQKMVFICPRHIKFYSCK